jgi:hypothetical protein
LNEPLKKDLLVDPASNFQTTVCLPKISVNKYIPDKTQCCVILLQSQVCI